MRYALAFERRINPSLVFSGVTPIVHRLDLGPSVTGRVHIPGFSDAWVVNGAVESISPNLYWKRLATLREPVVAQIVIEVAAGATEAHDVELLPLAALSLHEQHAAATAAFVLENSRTVHQLVNAAGCNPDAAGGTPELERARMAYEVLRRADIRYHYELAMYDDRLQAVRFPAQILRDGGYGGGTCIDVALLYAAVLTLLDCEPVIALLGSNGRPEHAVVVLDLTGSHGRPAILRGEVLDARCRGGTVAAIEVNAISSGEPFDDALSRGRSALLKLGAMWGVDVAAARRAGIRPLPIEPVFETDCSPADEPTEALARSARAALAGHVLTIVHSINDHDRGRQWDLTLLSGPRIHLGRGLHNLIRLNDMMISRQHAAISARDGTLLLHDLESVHGTFHCGTRLPPYVPVVLSTGDEFALGPDDNVRFRLDRVR